MMFVVTAQRLLSNTGQIDHGDRELKVRGLEGIIGRWADYFDNQCRGKGK